MYVANFILEFGKAKPEEAVTSLRSLLAACRMNGQILGREWPVVQTANGVRATVLLPERTSLNRKHRGAWVRKNWDEAARVAPPRVEVIGKDPEGLRADPCVRPSTYILFTTYLSLESPLRCGDCFRPVPLYRIPPTAGDEYHDILHWQSDYQACDLLQMNCVVGERFGERELSSHRSSLSKEGRKVCEHIQRLTKRPTYYYLYRYNGRSTSSERKRRCPGCGGPWLLPEPWHDMFHFRCEHCRLVSNIAWDV